MTINNYNKEDLLQITTYAEALMLPDELAILMDIPIEEHEGFIQIITRHQNKELYRAYKKGVFLTKFELHSKLVMLAKAGSPAAQLVVLELLKLFK